MYNYIKLDITIQKNLYLFIIQRDRKKERKKEGKKEGKKKRQNKGKRRRNENNLTKQESAISFRIALTECYPNGNYYRLLSSNEYFIIFPRFVEQGVLCYLMGSSAHTVGLCLPIMTLQCKKYLGKSGCKIQFSDCPETLE